MIEFDGQLTDQVGNGFEHVRLAEAFAQRSVIIVHCRNLFVEVNNVYERQDQQPARLGGFGRELPAFKQNLAHGVLLLTDHDLLSQQPAVVVV